MKRRACAIAVLLQALVATAALAAGDWQTLASVQAAAEHFVRTHHGTDAEIAVSARALDSRLRLPRCATPLQADAPKGFRAGRGTVRVRCTGSKPWQLFVPVTLTRQVPVVVARRALVMGTIIQAGDLDIEQRAESLLPRGFISDPTGITGLATRRSIARGNPITNHMVHVGRLVRRGQRVSLFTQRGGVFVKSDGIALADAGRSQRLAVKTRAGRVVEGIVRDADTVEIAR